RPPPKVVAITPASGSTLGDEEVTITGSGFQQGAIVRFADQPAASVTFVDSQKLVVKTPKGTPGPAAVTVENLDGGKHVVGGGFLYIQPPTIANVFPGLGPESGGTVVTIQGAGFVQGNKGSKVFFGSVEVPQTDVQIESVGIIKAKSPKGTGPVAVKIVNPDNQVAILAGGFVYIPVIPAPKVSYTQPGFAPTSGGIQVSVYGEGFLTGAIVSFGNDAIGYTKATENAVLNGGTLVVCKAPAHLPGTVNVKVTNSDGQSGIANNAFEFVAPLALPALAISGIVPDRGPTEGGYDTVLYGQGFKAGVEVFFGNSATASWTKAKTVVRLGPTLLRVEVPEAAKEGKVDVRVVNPSVGGKADEIVSKTLFTYGQAVILEPMSHRLPIDKTTGDGRPLIADFNGDGLNDVFVQRSTTDDLYIQVKDKAGEPGQFVDQSDTLPKYAGNCTSSNGYGEAHDLDGDGDVDIVFRGQNYYLCILRNEGDGTFKSEYHGNKNLYYMRDFAVGDVTCDGLADIVVLTTQANFVLVNNGKGGYDADTKLLPSHSEPSNSGALGDVDKDGDLDLLVGNDSAVQNRLYYNSCNNVAQGQPGSFQDASYGNGKNFPVSGFNTRTVLLDDLDGDGWLDAFVFNWGQTDRIYINKGGNFLADDGSRFPQEETLPNSDDAWARDVDGDGDKDLLVRKYQNVSGRYWVSLYLNEKSQTGQTKWTDASPSNLPQWRGEDSSLMAVDDLDADGLPDIYVVKTDHQDWLLINHGFADGKAPIDANRVPKGSFANNTFRGLPHDVNESSSAAAGDIDGDGDIDLVIGNLASGGISVWVNDGVGNFFEQGEVRVPDVGCGVSRLHLVDLNKDSDLDLMISCNYDWGGGTIGSVGAKSGSGGIRQLVNDGKGYFKDVSKDNLPYTYNNHRFYGMDLGDIDGDGDMDIVVGGFYSDPVEILVHGGDPFNNGGAYYFVKSNYLEMSQDYKYRTCFVLADLNADKNVDLYLGKSGAQNVLFHNTGIGIMKDVSNSHLPSVSDNSNHLLAADIDKDGDVDLFVINDGVNRLQISELDYKLADVTSSHLPENMSANSTHGALVDLDGDGLLDLITSTWGGRNQLLLNTGDAHFQDLTASDLTEQPPQRAASARPASSAQSSSIHGATNRPTIVSSRCRCSQVPSRLCPVRRRSTES
ncbi:MAG: VCBS repeat-containing protein, partial [Deltaproteobacteria bacterium]|nr:VCBS repeat-containing protein [Deltaproteobacteria bacterium]